jgi:hypothetical protein
MLHFSCSPIGNEDRFSLSIVLDVAEILRVVGVKILYDVQVYAFIYLNQKVRRRKLLLGESSD